MLRTYEQRHGVQIAEKTMYGSQPPNLLEAKRKLGELLGPEDFYAWASALPDKVIMSDTLYIKALEDEYLRLTTVDCDCNSANRDACNICTPIDPSAEPLPF